MAHVGKGIERILSAYQEALISIEQLRERMPGLRQRNWRSAPSCRQSQTRLTIGRTFLRLAETLTAFSRPPARNC